MNRLFEIILLLLVISACTSNEQRKSDTFSVKLNTLLAEYQEERLPLFPFEATSIGDSRYNHLLPNYLSQDVIETQKKFFSKYLKALSQIDREAMTDMEKVNYDILKWEFEISLEGLEFKDYLLPINHNNTLNITISQIAGGGSFQPFNTVKDYDDWLQRLDAYMVWCDTALVNMQKGIKQGYVLPIELARKVVPQLEAFDHGPVEEHLFYQPVKNFPDTIQSSDRARLEKAYRYKVENKVIPMYAKLKKFFQEEYIPASRTTAGITDTPLGIDYYNYLIKVFTTTTLMADEVFEIGEQEVERILLEMEQIKKEVGFKGDLPAFLKHVRENKKLMPFKKPEEVLENFRAIHKKIEPKLALMFSKVPKTALEIQRVPAYIEKTSTAYYIPGSIDPPRSGVFYVPVPDAPKYNIYIDEDLFLHEAVPGHHYQGSWQLENDSLPEFRKIIWYTAYGEGWALYAESLGFELGLYTDPYQRLGMLGQEIHRAIRLVVDAGIHTKGWTREQAIKYCLEREALTEEVITAEIERYMAWPGQAFAYKIGQRKILELRKKAEKELGSNFSLIEFHDQVLNPGCLPLATLEQVIDQWIAASKSQ